MRPWLQPLIYSKILNLLSFIFPNDPFTWILILRIFSSLLGYFSIVYLFYTFKDIFFQKEKVFNYFLFFTFWFYPFLHSRTSSENLSISLFLISFCILFKVIITKKINYNFIIFSAASFLMGVSMVIKYTTVFTALPFFAWILFFRFKLIKIIIFGLSILLALSFGLFIDYINWGSFKNTYYQFYYHNLSSGPMGAMKTFGSEPWYYFITEIIKQLAPLLSLFFFIGLVLFWINNLKNILTWITLFTFFIFSIISHKEIRYIFPVYIFAPFFIAYLFNFINKKLIKKIIKSIVIFSNLLFLLITLFFPANAKVGVYNFIYNNLQHDSALYYLGENPYQVNNMEPFIYTKFLPKINEYKNSKIKDDKFYLVTNDYKKFSNEIEFVCTIAYSTYPISIVELNKNWKRLKLNWRVYNCDKT